MAGRGERSVGRGRGRPEGAVRPLDPARARTWPLAARANKVVARAVGKPLAAGLTLREFLARLPVTLAAEELREVARAIVGARRAGRPVILGMGAHPIKVGLSPLIVDLLRRGLLSAVAMNGACLVHDFELAFMGATSEDVGVGLDRGRFGMARETGEFLNRAISEGVAAGLGLGRAVGERMRRGRLPYRRLSILAAAAELGLPATVHVAVGTDIVHMHPGADGAAIGTGSLRDFYLLAGAVARLEGGVFLNLGSAVVIPEVFVKALNLARNLGHRVEAITCVDMDFIRQYRPAVNVVSRPTARRGRGIHLTGHHEIMFPLLWGAVLEEMAARGRRRRRS